MTGIILQEISGRLKGVCLLLLGNRFYRLGREGRLVEDVREKLTAVSRLDEGGQITAAVAVVGRRPHRTEPSAEHEAIAIVDQLVATRQTSRRVLMVKLQQRRLVEEIATAAAGLAPRHQLILLRIGPEQIRERRIVFKLATALERLYLVDAAQSGTETTVNNEDLIVDERGHRQQVEDVIQTVIEVGVGAVLLLHLVVETVHFIDVARLVVATQKEHLPRSLELHQDEIEYRLDRVVTTIDIVAGETVAVTLVEILRLDHVEHTHEIVKLAVYVAYENGRRRQRQHVGFVDEQFRNLGTEFYDGGFFHWQTLS